MDQTADKVAIWELMNEYAASVDTHDPERFASLFTPDGELRGTMPDGSPSVRKGHQALMTELPAFKHPSPLTMHVVGNSAVDIDGERGTGWMHCVAHVHHVIDQDDELVDRVLFLRYDDEYVRTDEGWRFASRTMSTYWSEEVPAAGTVGLGERTLAS